MRRKDNMTKLVEKIKGIIEGIEKPISSQYEDLIEDSLKIPCTEELAYQIAMYAHKDQYRVNGEPYINHPLNMGKRWLEVFKWNSPNPYKTEAMNDNDIPRYGVLEVIFLHDVIEDTKYTMEDIEEVFVEYGHKNYFSTYIKKPLECITHRKKEKYEDYIEKVLSDKTAALVKMFDTMDNLNLFSLTELTEYEYKRSKKYLKIFKMINDKYHYIEKINHYREDIA